MAIEMSIGFLKNYPRGGAISTWPFIVFSLNTENEPQLIFKLKRLDISGTILG
jgi:hypothetical protein